MAIIRFEKVELAYADTPGPWVPVLRSLGTVEVEADGIQAVTAIRGKSASLDACHLSGYGEKSFSILVRGSLREVCRAIATGSNVERGNV